MTSRKNSTASDRGPMRSPSNPFKGFLRRTSSVFLKAPDGQSSTDGSTSLMPPSLSSSYSSLSDSPAQSFPPPVPQADRRTLLALIDTVSEAELRAILANVVHAHPGSTQALLRETRRVVAATEQRGGHTRCANCRGAFDPRTRHKRGECQFHPGALHPETFEFVTMGPEKAHTTRSLLMWTCCDEDQYSMGCITTEHVPSWKVPFRADSPD